MATAQVVETSVTVKKNMQFYSGLRSPRRSNSTYFWNDNDHNDIDSSRGIKYREAWIKAIFGRCILSLLTEVSHNEAKMRERRDLCRLPKHCLMKSPTRFLVKTYRFQNRFHLMCNARALWDWTMTIIEPTMEGVDRPTMTHNLVIVWYMTLLFCFNEDISQRFCSFVGNDGRLVVYFSQ